MDYSSLSNLYPKMPESIDISQAEDYISDLEVVGRQDPHFTIFNDEEADYTHAINAVQFYSRIGGYKLLPWQVAEVFKLLAVKKGTDPKDKIWLHRSSVLLVPRQNGKNEIIFCVCLYRLFFLNDHIYFTAQSFKAVLQHWNDRIRNLVENKALKGYIKNKGCSQGRAYIYTKSQGFMIMSTRNKDSERGISKIDLLIYDEAYDITDAEAASLDNLQKTARNPQVIYLSSPVNAVEHVNGVILSSIRRRAYDKKPDNMSYTEYCATSDMEYNDPKTWAYCNPTLGDVLPIINISEEADKVYSQGQLDNFNIETLGKGKWYFEDNAEEAEAEIHEPIIDLELWDKLKGVPDKRMKGDCAIAVDVSPKGNYCSIVSATRIGHDYVYISISKIEEFNRQEIVDTISHSVKENDPVAVILDTVGKAGTLQTPLIDAGIEPLVVTVKDLTGSTELFIQSVQEKKISHCGSPRLYNAIRDADFRSVGNSMKRAFKVADELINEDEEVDISPLVGMAFAIWALDKNEIKDVELPEMKAPNKSLPKVIKDRSSNRQKFNASKMKF